MTGVTSYNSISQCQCDGNGYSWENTLSLHHLLGECGLGIALWPFWMYAHSLRSYEWRRKCRKWGGLGWLEGT